MTFDELKNTLEPLFSAHRILQKRFPDHADRLVEEAVTVLQSYPDPIPNDKALYLLGLMHASLVSNAFLNQGPQIFQDLAENAIPAMKRAPSLARFALSVEQPAFERLLALGVPYARHIKPIYAIELWMSKGAVYGEAIWKKHKPRKNPAVAYWEENGFKTPDTLCEDGITLIANSIRDLRPSQITQGMHNALIRGATDWRLYLAFLIAGKVPDALQNSFTFHRHVGKSDAIRAEYEKLFGKTTSAHSLVERTMLLGQAVDLETLLRQPKSPLPASILPFFMMDTP